MEHVKETTYRATEGEEGLDQLVLREEGVASHQVNKSAKSSSPPLNELPLRNGGQNCGHIQEKTNICEIILEGKKCARRTH